jgi:hypothetical protein
LKKSLSLKEEAFIKIPFMLRQAQHERLKLLPLTLSLSMGETGDALD